MIFIYIIMSIWQYEWKDAQLISENPESNWPALIEDRKGRFLAVWSEDYFYKPTKMVYRYNVDGVWLEPETLGIFGSFEGFFPHLCLDSDGEINWLWGTAGGKVMWTRTSGDTWIEPVNIGVDTELCEYACMACNNKGEVHVVFDGYMTWHMYHRIYRDGVWSEPERIIWEYTRGRALDMKSDKEGRIHLIWRNMVSEQLEYSVYDDGEWGPVEVLTDYYNKGYVRDADMEIDRDGRVHIVYEFKFHNPEGGTSPHIYYMHSTDTGWSEHYKVDFYEIGEGFGGFPDLEIDSRGIVHIIFGQGERWGRLYHAIYDGEEFFTYRIDAGAGEGREGWNDLEIDEEDRLHIVWRHWPGSIDTCWIFYSCGEYKGKEERSRREMNFIGFDRGRVEFVMEDDADIEVSIYDLGGRRVYVEDCGRLRKGKHTLRIRRKLSAGIYFVRIRDGDISMMRKIVVTE